MNHHLNGADIYPVHHGEGFDMFTAGDRRRGKETVGNLANNLGFAHCYDFGGDDKLRLIE